MSRVRRKWSDEEDQALSVAVTRCNVSGQPILWHEIAKLIPERTNKDCRKRWFSRLSESMKKGTWSQSEDERLYEAVQKHGIKWVTVAGDVTTRNGDQCSKRWNNTIDPSIDHSKWTSAEEKLLLQAVEKFGHQWSIIVANYFPGRTPLATKNQYYLLTRKRSQASGPAAKRRNLSRTGVASVDDQAQRLFSTNSCVGKGSTPTGLDVSDAYSSSDEDDDLSKHDSGVYSLIRTPEFENTSEKSSSKDGSSSPHYRQSNESVHRPSIHRENTWPNNGSIPNNPPAYASAESHEWNSFNLNTDSGSNSSPFFYSNPPASSDFNGMDESNTSPSVCLSNHCQNSSMSLGTALGQRDTTDPSTSVIRVPGRSAAVDSNMGLSKLLSCSEQWHTNELQPITLNGANSESSPNISRYQQSESTITNSSPTQRVLIEVEVMTEKMGDLVQVVTRLTASATFKTGNNGD